MGQIPNQTNGKLNQIKGQANKKWRGLTDDELLKIKQKRALLVEKIQSEHTRRTTDHSETK